MLTRLTREELAEFPDDRPMPPEIAFGHYWDHWTLGIGLRHLFMKDDEWDNAYHVSSGLFRKLMNQEITEEEYREKYDDILDHPELYPELYGVCDDPMQVVANWPCLLLDDLEHFIAFNEVRRDEQPSSGGWRWHKWGSYIGEHETTQEYLYDEPDIEKVYTFKIYTFKEGVR